jgi:hypothetical protein
MLLCRVKSDEIPTCPARLVKLDSCFSVERSQHRSGFVRVLKNGKQCIGLWGLSIGMSTSLPATCCRPEIHARKSLIV